MKLSDLTHGLEHKLLQGTEDKEVSKLIYFSEEAEPGCVFFAIPGLEKNGMDYLADAVRGGAVAAVIPAVISSSSQNLSFPFFSHCGDCDVLTVLQVEDVREMMALMCSRFFGNPCSRMKMIGITGTKGKTSTAFMLWEILKRAGLKPGLMGTVKNGWEGNFFPATHTTAEALEIQSLCKNMADAGCKAAIMEVSSQAMKMNRVAGIKFDVGIFTNLSPDHIGPGEHDSFEDYVRCKVSLMEQCDTIVYSGDEPLWKEFAESLNGITFGEGDGVDFRCEELRPTGTEAAAGIVMCLEGHRVEVPVVGRFNGLNGAGAAAAARELGVSWEDILCGLKNVRIPGRMEAADVGERRCVLIDYAHNGVSLKNALRSLREYEPKRIILVFGCGGNRDPHRRAEMGQAAAWLAELTIVTDDNPRWESPEKIRKEITDAMDREIAKGAAGRYKVEPERRQAIFRAEAESKEDDIVLIAGKGHECEQLVKGERRYFSDRQEAELAARKLGLMEKRTEHNHGGENMRTITVKEIIDATGGSLMQGSTGAWIKGAAIDSREVTEKNGFFPVKGARVDGHDFLKGVLEKGCRTLIVSDAEKVPGEDVLRGMGIEKDDVNVVLVDDTLRALQQLAKYYISTLPLKKKIAVTGSVGKTSTRDMLYYVASTKYKTGRNQKNYNNEFGLPLTILGFDDDLEVAVLEMGMDSFGEIDLLADIVRPDIAVITNVGISHIENLGSRENIRKAKMEVTGYFNEDSVLVVNQTCDLLQKEMVAGNYQVVTVGSDGKSDFVISNICDFGDRGIKYTLDRNHKQYEVNLPVPGAHNAGNATLAIAVGEILGVSIGDAVEGLERAELTAKRLNVRGKNGIKVIDDTYNAAPESMRSAINTLLATKGIRKVAILSDMKELGPESQRLHYELGEYIGEKHVDALITVGNDAKFIGEGAVSALGQENVCHYDTKEAFMNDMEQHIRPGDVVLVKGSRSMEMERVVKKIFEE